VPNKPAGSGFPKADPFEAHQPEIDIAREGARDRGDDRRNTGRLPDRPASEQPSGEPARRRGHPGKA
jgi:hypothetical protein